MPASRDTPAVPLLAATLPGAANPGPRSLPAETSLHAAGTEAGAGEPAEHRPSQSPLASTTPPPISLASVRAIAAKPGAELPVDLLVAMHTMLIAQGNHHWAAELDTLFDLETGRSRAPASTAD